MSDEIVKQTATTQTLIQLQAPVRGEVVHGLTLQSDAAALAKMTRVRLRRELQKRIAEDIAWEQAAQRELAEAQTALHQACERELVPADLYADLDAIVRPLLKFFPGATTQRTRRDGQPFPLNVSAFNFDAGKFTAAGKIVDGANSELLHVSRDYPVPTAIAELQKKQELARINLAAARESLQHLRNDMTRIEEEVDAVEAAVIQHGIRQTASGKEVLDTLDKEFAKLEADLDKRRAGLKTPKSLKS